MWTCVQIMTFLILHGILRGNGVHSFDDWEVPRFLEEPPNSVEFYNTQGTVIRCSADGRPSPKVTWVKRNGTALQDIKGLRHVRADGSLVFPPFRAEEYRQDIHAGVYRCTAANILGIVGSREVHVRAVIVQQFDIRVYDEFVMQGSTAVLKCHIPAFAKGFVTVSAWYRDDGRVLQADALEGRKYIVLPTGELHIRDVQQQDGFRGYRCQVKLHLTGETKHSLTAGQVIVTEPHTSVPPRITHRETEVRGREGQTVVLPCAAQSSPPPQYTWLKVSSGRLFPVVRSARLEQVSGTLTIRHVQLEDAGKYVCLVNNSAGQETADTQLTVTVPLRVTITPTEHRAQLGQSVVFNCSVTGKPIHGITWFKNMVPVNTGDRVRTVLSALLTINSVQREDKGVYQCFVYNNQESVQATAVLLLGDAMPVLDAVFTERTLQPSSSVSLKCATSGSPLPQVTWNLDGLPLPDLLRFRVGDYVTRESRVVSYVNISSVRSEDGGVYGCTAQNDVGKVFHSARIDVVGPPAVRPMPNVTVLAGGRLEVKCPAGGYPIPSIVWERDSRPLPQNHRQEIFPNGTLIVNQVNRKSDKGKYTCIVKNDRGDVAKGDLYVQVLVGPRIDPFSFPTDLEDGMRSVVLCSVRSGDPPLKISWLKDGRPIPQELVPRIDMINDFTSTLTFGSVSPAHGGRYTCLASNPAAAVNYTSAMVVNVPPYWTVQPMDAVAVVDSQVVLDCQADGHPPPQIRWKSVTAEGQTSSFQTVTSNPHIQILENGSLVIRDVTPSDAVDYMCQATNGVSPGLSAVLKLSVHVPAHFKVKFQSITAKKGEALKLSCEALGEKPLLLKWAKDKQEITNWPDSRYNTEEVSQDNGTVSHLIIPSTERSDSAVFSCLASNPYGSDEQTIQLIILERPDSPREFHMKGLTSRAATVAWTQPFSGNTPITGYMLYYKTASENWKEDSHSVSVPPTEVSTTVTGLLPVTDYHFRVFAENSLGRSEASEVLSVTSLEEAPSAPPSEIYIEPLSSEALRVTWKAPMEDIPKGQVAGYYIGYKELGSSDQYSYKTLKSTGRGIQEYKLRHLQRSTKYTIRVQAFNGAGSGPASDDVVVQTLQYDPPTAPEVQLKEVQATSVTIVWRKTNDMPVTGFILQHREESQSEWTEERLTQDLTTYRLEPLKCGSRYQVRLLAVNAVGEGEPSDTLQFRTEGTAPIAPEKPNFLTVNSTFVLLHLEAWQSGGCASTSFVAQYKPFLDPDWHLLSPGLLAEPGPVTLHNLTPGTWYNIRMNAHNDAGSTDAEYVFATLTSAGEPVSPLGTSSSSSGQSFYKQLNVIVLAICMSVIVVVIIVVILFVCSKRCSGGRPGAGGQREDCQGRSSCLQKGEALDMAPLSKKGSCPNYANPKESVYLPAPYATSRLASYEDGTSECDSLHSSGRNESRPSHTYDVPFPVRRASHEEQYTTIKHSNASSGPVNNIYHSPRLPDCEKWVPRLSYSQQQQEQQMQHQQQPREREPSFSFKVDSPSTRRWSGGYRTPFRKDQPFRLKRLGTDTYRFSDEACSDLEDEHDRRQGEMSETECDRNQLTVAIPPEERNFYILTGAVH